MARILLVEDYELVLRYLCEAIHAAGHQADCVATKREAEAKLAAGRYDALCTNIRLPDGSGHELAIKASDLGIKVVLMTGHPDEVVALSIAEVAHLEKPFRAEELLHLIEHTLGA